MLGHPPGTLDPPANMDAAEPSLLWAVHYQRAVARARSPSRPRSPQSWADELGWGPGRLRQARGPRRPEKWQVPIRLGPLPPAPGAYRGSESHLGHSRRKKQLPWEPASRAPPNRPEAHKRPRGRPPPQTAACARSPTRTLSAATVEEQGDRRTPGRRSGAGHKPRAGGSRCSRGPGSASPAAAAPSVEQEGRRGDPAHARRPRCHPAPPPPALPPH